MSEPDYAEALRLIRKHMQSGDTVGQMFMRVAKELEVADCSCARAGFPGSCHNCDADSGPIKYWRERALQAEKSAKQPVAWVIPGDNNAKDNGFIDAMAWEEGEFTKPLYALSRT